MPRDLDREGFYLPLGTPLYNIHLKGGGLHTRVTVRGFESLRPENIDWVWVVVARRRATPAEIRELCKVHLKGR
jgi:hypothetical protein